MTINDQVYPLTTGNITITPYQDNTYWPNGTIPYQDTYYIQPQWPLYPLACSSDCHVFACEHATKCKCGKASRKVEPQKCGTCGK